MAEKLLTEEDVSALIGRAVATLQKDRVYGSGIPFVKVGRRAMYREGDVAAYLAALPAHRSTSEFMAKRHAGGRPRKPRDDDPPNPPPLAAE